MALDFNELLSADQKRGILTQRIQQFAVEAYQHHLNATTAESLGNEDAVAASQEALVTLEAAIAANQAELDSLDEE
jgi:hypothetical protein